MLKRRILVQLENILVVAAVAVVFLIFFMVIGFWQTRHSSETTAVQPNVVSKVARVFMHEPHRFTFLVKNDNGSLGQLTVDSANIEIIPDVIEVLPMWVVYTCASRYDRQTQNYAKIWNCKPLPSNFSHWRTSPAIVKIHIHSAEEINGADWNHGKFGRGQTIAVE